jgi:ribonuclease-3
MTDDINDFLGHAFGDPALLEQALTHRSSSGGEGIGYERLEFLGDRVLALVVADRLLAAFPEEDEGALAKRYTALVRRETLASIAREVGLGPHIRLSRGEDESGGRENDAILSDVCEAVIAAIYLDGGIDAARAFIDRHWTTRLEATPQPPQDAKTALQEWAQGRGLALPDYRTVGQTGPDHAPTFKVTVAIEGHEAVEGIGPTKRAAEQEAAERLLKDLGNDD